MIGTTELILILIVALFLFGSNKLPELARSLGRAAGEFKKARIETEHQLKGNEKLNEKDTKIHNLAVELGLQVQKPPHARCRPCPPRLPPDNR